MNSTGLLDDYLDELLGDAIASAPRSDAAPASTAPRPADADAPDAEREPTWDDLPAEIIYETGTVAPDAAFDTAGSAGPCPADATATAAEREPTWDDLPAEVIYETGTVAAELDAAIDTAGSAGPCPADATATAEREPTWDDLPAEVIYETGTVAPELDAAFDTAGSAGPCPADATATATAPAPEPTWDDLPDEVIYETDAAESLAHTDSPGLQAAFEAAAVGDVVPPPAAPIARVAAAAPAPAARAAVAPPPRVAVDAPAANRPGTWQELQAQAHQPASSPHPQSRRASERTSRWLRLRCGSQAYALELLKVQEVVLPVPLLPLRGTAPAMLGIMNLRGQVVPVMDLGLHLGAASAADDAQTRIVVLEEDGETLGLRVSAVEDVANLTDSQIEPPDTARICQISNELFRGVARISQRPMILLDATQLLG
ncbi:chemotaxis protein CheW [Stenotrophomonas maltophilia]|uniref:chemotaxis protein CheW n=1 Tax=Stenotrophomonas maltophilia TaxID=40324 RepID=UPI0034DB2A4B